MKIRRIDQLFHFGFPAGTSRGVLHTKLSRFIRIENKGITGIGECSTIPGISIDDETHYDTILDETMNALETNQTPDQERLLLFPSLAFGIEMALTDLNQGGKRLLFDNAFARGTSGIPINGLIWMGSREAIEQQIRIKIDAGFRCIKIKIGALDFNTELDILRNIRKQYPHGNLELRLDANGAFAVTDALEKLKQLSEFNIHSIEQPISRGNVNAMAELCALSPIPIALDEELTGVTGLELKKNLLRTVQPAYLIIKPSMLGGFKASEEWISLARENNTGWWITSALESNIGLNAIAQWTASLDNPLPQGLGTGRIYTDNIPSPLRIEGNKLFHHPEHLWNLEMLNS